ncbi:unnamed protein product [Trichogramma brassicae]|uniref:Uncharacterized protein n=1 Tax=Trichogramma brassicae TaxID=86971 RepID=A0A6H5IPH3_9HYME|nr:unnamed protein product [Trichogramma brassicae]
MQAQSEDCYGLATRLFYNRRRNYQLSRARFFEGSIAFNDASIPYARLFCFCFVFVFSESRVGRTSTSAGIPTITTESTRCESRATTSGCPTYPSSTREFADLPASPRFSPRKFACIRPSLIVPVVPIFHCMCASEQRRLERVPEHLVTSHVQALLHGPRGLRAGLEVRRSVQHRLRQLALRPAELLHPHGLVDADRRRGELQFPPKIGNYVGHVPIYKNFGDIDLDAALAGLAIDRTTHPGGRHFHLPPAVPLQPPLVDTLQWADPASRAAVLSRLDDNHDLRDRPHDSAAETAIDPGNPRADLDRVERQFRGQQSGRSLAAARGLATRKFESHRQRRRSRADRGNAHENRQLETIGPHHRLAGTFRRDVHLSVAVYQPDT